MLDAISTPLALHNFAKHPGTTVEDLVHDFRLSSIFQVLERMLYSIVRPPALEGRPCENIPERPMNLSRGMLGMPTGP
jgi:hypothetical protein